MAITIPTTVKVAKFKFRPTLKNVDGQVYKMLFGLAPVVLVYLTTQANITIANYFLTRFEGGSVTAFYYAQMLFIAIVTIIVYAISAVMFPKFNKTIKDNRVEFFSNLSQVAQSIIVLMLPITICLILFSQPIVEIIFLRGDFTIDNAQLTANLLKILSIYMIAYGFLDVLNRGYFTLDDKKTPIVATCTILASSFVLNFIFVNILNLEVYSIALSTVIAYFIGALVSALLFSKKYGNLGIRKIIKSFLKALVACIAMFSIYLILHSAFGDEFSKVNIFAKLIVLCIEGVSVMLAYVGVLLLLKEKNLYEFISKAKNKNEKQ